MNTNLKFFNGVRTTALVCLTAGTLACSEPSKSLSVQAATPTYPNVAPSDYGIQALKIISDRTGQAYIKLDSFRLLVEFNYLAHPDSYGVAGTEYTAVEITDFRVNQIVDSNGNEYRDFTDYNDTLNIIHLIVAHIEKNQLVEVKS